MEYTDNSVFLGFNTIIFGNICFVVIIFIIFFCYYIICQMDYTSDVFEGKDRDKRARKEENQNVLSSLPDEILLPILSYLSTVDLARVCGVNRRLRDLCRDVALQKRLVVKVDFLCSDAVGKAALSAALEKIDTYKNLEQLVLRHTRHNVRLACMALEKCASLESIEIVDFKRARINMHSLLSAIGSHGKSLQVLKISTSKPVEGIPHNVQFLSNLSHLELLCVNKAVLRAVVDHCKRLKHFYFQSCDGHPCDDDDMNYYLEGLKDSLEEISVDERFKRNSIVNVRKCRKLKKVNLELRDIRIKRGVAEEILASIVTLPELKVLKMSYCCYLRHPWPGSEDFARALSGEKSIEVLALTNFSGMLDDLVLAAIADSCRNSLVTLKLKDCCNITDVGVWRILRECESLVDLHLSSCRLVSCEVFSDIRVVKVPVAMRSSSSDWE